MPSRDEMIGRKVRYNGIQMVVVRSTRQAGVDWAYLVPVKGEYSLDDVVKVNIAGIQELRAYVYRDK